MNSTNTFLLKLEISSLANISKTNAQHNQASGTLEGRGDEPGTVPSCLSQQDGVERYVNAPLSIIGHHMDLHVRNFTRDDARQLGVDGIRILEGQIAFGACREVLEEEKLAQAAISRPIMAYPVGVVRVVVESVGCEVEAWPY